MIYQPTINIVLKRIALKSPGLPDLTPIRSSAWGFQQHSPCPRCPPAKGSRHHIMKTVQENHTLSLSFMVVYRYIFIGFWKGSGCSLIIAVELNYQDTQQINWATLMSRPPHLIFHAIHLYKIRRMVDVKNPPKKLSYFTAFILYSGRFALLLSSKGLWNNYK